jgi:hypothetical protein
MGTDPSSETKDKTSESPAPEVLKPQSEEVETSSDPSPASASKLKLPKRMHRGSYRPSHKATFIGVVVIAVILAINAGVIYFFMSGGTNAAAQINRDEVTLSSETLDKLGVSRNNVGDLGTELTIGPKTKFGGSVTIAGDASVGGELVLNSKFTASEASLAKLQAGDTSVNKLDVNGDLTASNVNVGRDLAVVGTTRLQGAVTMSQILTVNNNVNIAGSLAIGGSLSVRNFQVNTLTVAGHLISTGAAPSVSVAGGAVGSNGTVSVSGNDTSGTVGVNVGAGASAGCMVTVTFRQTYAQTPHVVVTGSMPANVYLSGRTANGFTICSASPLPPGGYFVDYIVVQ